MKGRLLLLVALVAELSVPRMLRAQAVGQILGTVTDPSGAVVPDVKITAVQTATGMTRTTVSSSLKDLHDHAASGGQL